MIEKKNPSQVSAYIDEWTMAQIKDYATREDRSVSWIVGFAVKQFFVAQQKPTKSTSQIDIEDAIAATKPAAKKASKRK
jgi:hypothetical protein